MTDALRTNQAAVATHHALGTEAARQMLLAGGNAVDAAVAAMTTLCVVVPGSVALAGYGGCMVAYDAASGQTTCLDFDSKAPLEYRDALYADNAKAKASIGYLAIGVPAVIAGLATALSELGTKTWKDVTLFATELADNGFEVDQHNRTVLEAWHKSADDLSRRAHFPESNGVIPKVGERWVQKDLADCLRKLADEGPEVFYRGDIAEKIVRQVRENGGILSLEDMAEFQPRDVEPLRIDYRGHTIITTPPPAGGLTALQVLRTLEQFDLGAMDPESAEYLHLVAETCKLCWADRSKFGDPDFVKLNFAEFLSPSLASSRATQIRRQDIKTGVEARIDDFPHTCNVSVVDRDGNVVSLTATQGAQFGSGVVIDGLGLVLGHGMSRFDYNKPGHANAPAPGKRPLHNMCPAIILKNDRPFAAIGLPGGTRIPTVTAQLAVSLIDFAASPEQTVHATRVHSEGPEPLVVSKSIDPQTARDLESMGHKLTYGDHALGVPLMVGGPANVVRIDDDGTPTAASTAAKDAAAIV